jgi:hypothetical protein
MAKGTKSKAEAVVADKTGHTKFTDEQLLISNLDWMKFKVNKKMFTPNEIALLLKLTAQYKQV